MLPRLMSPQFYYNKKASLHPGFYKAAVVLVYY